MRNQDSWSPGKFLLSNGHIAATNDSSELTVASRLTTNLVARLYSEQLPRHASGRMLDLGCGRVPFWEFYRQYVSDSYCVDWQESSHSDSYLDAVADLNHALPLADESFDVVLLSDVLEHIRRPVSLLSEISRVLAPGGKLIMNVPFYYWLHEQPYDYYRYTRYGLDYMAREAGLDVVVLEPTGGALEVLADISGKLLVKLPLFGRPLTAILQASALFFFRSAIGQRVFRKTAGYFPLGYFLVAKKQGG